MPIKKSATPRPEPDLMTGSLFARVPLEAKRSWARAAKQEGIPFSRWVAQTLNAKAKETNGNQAQGI